MKRPVRRAKSSPAPRQGAAIPPAPRQRAVNSDDAELWRRVQATAQALDNQRFHPLAPPADDEAPLPAAWLAPMDDRSPAESSSLPPLVGVGRPAVGRGPTLDHIRPPALPDLQPFREHGDQRAIDRATGERLRRGKLPIERRLDLHGMTRERAHRRLTEFLIDSQRTGRRLVLVVTGKGDAARGGGLLRREVPLWLNLSPLRELVLTYDHARPEQGGLGALTILLKRRRDRP